MVRIASRQCSTKFRLTFHVVFFIGGKLEMDAEKAKFKSNFMIQSTWAITILLSNDTWS